MAILEGLEWMFLSQPSSNMGASMRDKERLDAMLKGRAFFGKRIWPIFLLEYRECLIFGIIV